MFNIAGYRLQITFVDFQTPIIKRIAEELQLIFEKRSSTEVSRNSLSVTYGILAEALSDFHCKSSTKRTSLESSLSHWFQTKSSR